MVTAHTNDDDFIGKKLSVWHAMRDAENEEIDTVVSK